MACQTHLDLAIEIVALAQRAEVVDDEVRIMHGIEVGTAANAGPRNGGVLHS